MKDFFMYSLWVITDILILETSALLATWNYLAESSVWGYVVCSLGFLAGVFTLRLGIACINSEFE